MPHLRCAKLFLDFDKRVPPAHAWLSHRMMGAVVVRTIAGEIGIVVVRIGPLHFLGPLWVRIDSECLLRVTVGHDLGTKGGWKIAVSEGGEHKGSSADNHGFWTMRKRSREVKRSQNMVIYVEGSRRQEVWTEVDRLRQRGSQRSSSQSRGRLI